MRKKMKSSLTQSSMQETMKMIKVPPHIMTSYDKITNEIPNKFRMMS